MNMTAGEYQILSGVLRADSTSHRLEFLFVLIVVFGFQVGYLDQEIFLELLE